MIVLALLILFLVMAPAAYAKGGSSRTVDAVGPKSQSLIDLENRFYGMANQIMDGYTGTYAPPQTGTTQPSAPSAGAGKGGARGGVPTSAPQATASASKGGARGGASGGNYWSNDNLMGRLLNDATKKTLASNRRYDELMRRAPELSQGSLDALASANDALRQSWTAGDPYFSQANQNYADAKRLLGVGESYLRQAPTAGDEWYAKARDVC